MMLSEFHVVVGETLMECQRIEHDIKLIYAGMLKGDFEQNLNSIKNETLGAVLIELERLDNCDGNPYFKFADYKLLREIKNVRNWLAHKAYMDFMYDKDIKWQINFNKCCTQLTSFYNKMKNLGNLVEVARLNILKRYGRIR